MSCYVYLINHTKKQLIYIEEYVDGNCYGQCSKYLLLKLRSHEWNIDDDIQEYHKTYYVGDQVYPLLKKYDTFMIDSDGLVVKWSYLDDAD